MGSDTPRSTSPTGEVNVTHSPEYELVGSLFFPRHLEARKRVEEQNSRFVHYTSASVALNIMRDPHFWMRNAITMNDFSEIQHGKKCVLSAYKDPDIGLRLTNFLNSIHPEFSKLLEEHFNGWLPHFEQDTFLISLSEHLSEEDKYGRLSMWRAYGQGTGVALVLRNTPFMAETNDLKAFSSPVLYATPEQYADNMRSVVNNIITRKDEVASLSFETLFACMFMLLKNDLLCTKHPGFSEEREWRVYYSPTVERSNAIVRDFAVVDGIPQIIHKIPLINDPNNGLHSADIPSLFERIIIGPSKQPLTIFKAFSELLKDLGIENPEERIFVSDIPLRT